MVNGSAGVFLVSRAMPRLTSHHFFHSMEPYLKSITADRSLTCVLGLSVACNHFVVPEKMRQWLGCRQNKC